MAIKLAPNHWENTIWWFVRFDYIYEIGNQADPVLEIEKWTFKSLYDGYGEFQHYWHMPFQKGEDEVLWLNVQVLW